MQKKLHNFGKNVRFTAEHYYEPKTEDEVLDILNEHKSGTIRVIASGHAWSDAIKSTDVCINMRHLNAVSAEKQEDGSYIANIGAGAVLQHILNVMHAKTPCTLPTLGGIRKQTISGATSTGTHGSGRPSLSHYLTQVRIAAYDKGSGAAKIYTYRDGEELRAARCALGCMGVVVSVSMPLVPKYNVAADIRELDSLDDALAIEAPDCLEQFIVLPFSWHWYVYERRVAKPDEEISAAKKYYNRLFDLFVVDIGMHLGVVSMARLVARRWAGLKLVRFFYSKFIPWSFPVGQHTLDESESALTIAHDLFTHIEMEAFVPKSKMHDVVSVLRYIIEVAAGATPTDPSQERIVEESGEGDALRALAGEYPQHYPIYFRRLPADDTLISMTSDIAETHYSMSVFTYYPEGRRQPYFDFCTIIARVLARAYGIRFHWGKYNPLTSEDIEPLFPHLARFREIARGVDPDGTFQNDFTREKLGF